MNHKTEFQHALRDAQLSLKAKGLFALLCELGGELPTEQLAQLSRDGETAIHSGLRELVEHGYLERVLARGEHNPRWQRRIVKHG
jgi:hypothetical protein